MKQKLNFTKSQGLGNDFILIDAIRQRVDIENLRLMAPKLCDRHFGIGGDGIILATESESSDIKMTVINSDGSEPEMCGNGLRCFAKWVVDEALIEKEMFSVETAAGVRVPALIKNDHNKAIVEVAMGAPILNPSDIPVQMELPEERCVKELIEVDGVSYFMTAVSMGNPHAVVFVDELKSINITELGPKFSSHKRFPSGVNVEFVQVLTKTEAVVIVWERGAGETLACGTGACATLVAGVLEDRLDTKALIHLPGGPLTIEWASPDSGVIMTGPVQEVFRGSIEL